MMSVKVKIFVTETLTVTIEKAPIYAAAKPGFLETVLHVEVS